MKAKVAQGSDAKVKAAKDNFILNYSICRKGAGFVKVVVKLARVSQQETRNATRGGGSRDDNYFFLCVIVNQN